MAYSTLDGTTSVYNITHHIAVPTNAYFTALTGIDLVVEGDDSETVAKKLLGLTLQARDYLFQDRSHKTRKTMEYLIAFDENWRRDFITYAARFVEASYTLGEEHILGNKDLPKLVNNSIKGSLLKAYAFDWETVNEMETSEEEW